jgi:hypothetical protein
MASTMIPQQLWTFDPTNTEFVDLFPKQSDTCSQKRKKKESALVTTFNPVSSRLLRKRRGTRCGE